MSGSRATPYTSSHRASVPLAKNDLLKFNKVVFRL
jgi:hypothetical protein